MPQALGKTPGRAAGGWGNTGNKGSAPAVQQVCLDIRGELLLWQEGDAQLTLFGQKPLQEGDKSQGDLKRGARAKSCVMMNIAGAGMRMMHQS